MIVCRPRHALAVVAVAAVIGLTGCGTNRSPAPGVSLATTVAPRVVITAVPTTLAPASTPAPTTSTSTTTTTIHPDLVRRSYLIDTAIHTSFTPEAHANYRATDLFATTNCGTPLLSPVDGVVDEILLDSYDRATDDPAKRGGNAVSIIGDDGVRYYLAHLESFDPMLAVGGRVAAGQQVGVMGTTGRSGACHVHFGLSLPCPDSANDWWIRRGVIWPDRYLDAWKAGENLSPLPELQEWFAQFPDACRSVDDTPYPRA